MLLACVSLVCSTPPVGQVVTGEGAVKTQQCFERNFPRMKFKDVKSIEVSYM